MMESRKAMGPIARRIAAAQAEQKRRKTEAMFRPQGPSILSILIWVAFGICVAACAILVMALPQLLALLS